MMTRVLLLVFGIAYLAVAIHAAAVPPELATLGKTARVACLKESGVAEESVEKAGDGDFANDDKLKCYFKCIFDQFALIDEEDQSINFDAMLALVPEAMKEDGTRMIQNCRKETGTDLCDQAYNINKCFFKENPKGYFVV